MSAGPAAVPADVQPVLNETRDRIITGIVTVAPFLALGVACWQMWSDLLHWRDVLVFGVMYFATGLGVTVGFHRLFTHRSFATSRPVRADPRGPGLGRDRGPRDLLGRGSSQAPCLRRQGRRSAQPACRPWRGMGRRGEGPPARPRGLAVHPHAPRREAALRARPDEGPGDAGSSTARSSLWALGGLGLAFGLGFAIGGTVEAGPRGAAVGRRRAHAGRAPRHLQHQLPLPLLRRAATSPRPTSRATSCGSPPSPSASPGTTTTMPSRLRPHMACASTRSTSRRW